MYVQISQPFYSCFFLFYSHNRERSVEQNMLGIGPEYKLFNSGYFLDPDNDFIEMNGNILVCI